MASPTVASLCRTLGTDLSPAIGFVAPTRDVSSVHVSELPDPTSYLTGGELLLTTGLSLPRSRLSCERYAARLVEADISALALGLGPVHDAVPAALASACDKVGLPLLVVPAPTPFQTITKAYWVAVSRTAQEQLKDVLVTQRNLVEAAASSDPVHAVLRILSRSLEAWAAQLSPTGDVELVVPVAARDQAAQVRDDVARLQGAGVHSSASFATGTDAVVVFPLAVDEDVAGFLAVGTPAPLDADRRHAVLTASALLSLDAVRQSRSVSVDEEAERCVALLLDLGQVEAARQLAAVVHAPIPPPRVRMLAVSGRESAVLTAAVRHWCPTAIAARAGRHSAWFVLPGDPPATSALQKTLRRADPTVRGALSETVPVEQAGSARVRVVAIVDALPPGSPLVETGALLGLDDGLSDQLRERLGTLPETLVASLVGYLRHQHHWEGASRSLGVHRNTLRHRIARCQSALGIDLDDPDVAAALWLLLRRRGLA